MARDAGREAEEEGGEFADFLADVSKEIAQRVESLDKKVTPAAALQFSGSGVRRDILSGTPNEIVNYWQRHWLVGVRLKQLYTRRERGARNSYYFDDHGLTQSPIVPPETH